MPAPETIFTLKAKDVPLCVECLSCRHRGVLEASDLKRMTGIEDMSSLASISRKLKCSACRSKAVRVFRPHDRSMAATFLIGPATVSAEQLEPFSLMAIPREGAD